MTYFEDFQPINLANAFIEIETELREVGELYDMIYHQNGVNSMDDLTKTQKAALNWHSEGCDVGEQIYDLYSLLGCLLQHVEEMEKQ